MQLPTVRLSQMRKESFLPQSLELSLLLSSSGLTTLIYDPFFVIDYVRQIGLAAVNFGTISSSAYQSETSND